MATTSDGRVCCIVVCPNARAGANPTVGYHPFPAEDAALRRLWISFVGPANPDRFRWRGKYICSEHFQAAEVIERDGEKVLLEDSIPTIFAVEEDEDENEDVTPLELNVETELPKFVADPIEEEVIEEEIELRNLFCRICLGKHQVGMVPLSSRLRDHLLLDMIHAVTGLKITSEGIVPNRICPGCVTKIDLAYSVREEFLQRERILRDMLAANQLEKYYGTCAGSPAELPNQAYLNGLIAAAGEVKKEDKKIEVLAVETIVPATVVLPFEETVIEEIPIAIEEEHLYEVAEQDEIISIEDDSLPEDEEDEEVDSQYTNAAESICSDSVEEKIEQSKPPEVVKPVGKVEPSVKEPITIVVIPQKLSSIDQPGTSYHVPRPTLMDPKSCHICFTHHVNTKLLAQHLDSHAGMLPYRCERCHTDGTAHQQIGTVAALNEHVGRHQFPFQCGFCDKRFSDEQVLFEHMRGLHEGEPEPETGGFTCKTCGQQFAKRALYRHHMTRHEALEDERFKCSDCSRIFGSALLLRLHRKIHTDPPPKLNPYTCYVCNFSYEDDRALETHLEQHVGMLPYRCEQCSTEECPKVAKSLTQLNKHLRTHQFQFQCARCPLRFSTRKSRHHHNYHAHSKSNADGYTCSKCGHFFTLLRKFQLHMSKHRAIENEAFKCVHCGKAFSSSTLLKRHERIHTGEKPFECEKCGKRFNHKDNFLVHKRKHIDERGHHCTECDKQFFDAVNLRYHMGTHFPDNPRYKRPSRESGDPNRMYYCSVEGCEYSTRKASSMYYHKGKHDKKFQCEFCLWRWPTNSCLMQHIRLVHEGHRLPRKFECPYCPSKFPSRQKLEMHVDVHEDNRRYRCRFCDKTFVQSSNRTQHERTHTKEKPFGCAYCPSKFSSATGRKRHELAQHSSAEVGSTTVVREEVVEQSSAEDLKVIVELIGVGEPLLLADTPVDDFGLQVMPGLDTVEVRQVEANTPQASVNRESL